ncbi:MAG: NmrA family NAD(P)-binding protein [Xanthomonadales bacterium]|nr:NmrA family NAD(P)-binding protein [Xanthomonadales bacterium]
MSKRFFRKVATIFLGATALIYVVLLVINTGHEFPMNTQDLNTERHQTIAVFGATGTIGDGILKAAMNDPHVNKIHVVTRRASPRIEQGVASGKVEMTLHSDYLDYSAIRGLFADVDTVYWAIGLSAVGLDPETYREIHRDFPMRFASEWLEVSGKGAITFHYVSGAGAKLDSRMMWAKEKALAEDALKKLAEGTSLRVVSYRPSFIKPTEAELKFMHKALYAIFAPIGLAVSAESIGQAMLETSARAPQFQNGTILENRDIMALGEAYMERRGAP